MCDGKLRVASDFREGLPVRGVVKNRVVTKSCVAASLSRDFALDDPACLVDDLTVADCRQRADEACRARAIGTGIETPEDLGEPFGVARLAAKKTGRSDTGFPTEGVDDQAGVLGHRQRVRKRIGLASFGIHQRPDEISLYRVQLTDAGVAEVQQAVQSFAPEG
jgi:hypothetical protein